MRIAYPQAIVHEPVSVRARVLQRGARMVFKPLMRFMPISDRSFMRIQTLDALQERRSRSPQLLVDEIRLAGVRAETMCPRNAAPSGMTVLYLHGGGFFSGSVATHRRICEFLALATGATLHSLDYVQLPQAPVAASVQDAIEAYAALLERVDRPDRIVVAGDSAGGYLAMKIAELAARRGLQAPAAILCFSPLLSLDPERQDKPVQRVVRSRDAYLPVRRLAGIRERWTPTGVTIEGETSPLDAVDLISSPTYLVTVEDEILRPEVEAMALLLAERRVRVETHIWRRQIHAFPVLVGVLPESRIALQQAADFALSVVGERP